jgi:carbonic anhydrase
MSIYSSATSWGGACSATAQSPINLSQSFAKPCDLLCDLVFDDAMIPQANVMISDEGMILQSTTSLGSCKFNGEGYMCNQLLLTHPSHHTIENIQADAEVVAIFTNPTGQILCVSSLIRVNPAETSSTHFFNSFIPYANPSEKYTAVNLGDNWGLFMMVPPTGSYFVYDGSMVIPPCQSVKWVVFKAMINMDSNNFAILTKNVSPGSRPVQPLGDREVFFNDVQQLPGGPMPHDNKTYMRCRRTGKKSEVKPVERSDLTGAKKKASPPSGISKWAGDQISKNGILALLDVVLLLCAFGFGIYYGWLSSRNVTGLYIAIYAQKMAAWIRGFFIKAVPTIYTSAD